MICKRSVNCHAKSVSKPRLRPAPVLMTTVSDEFNGSGLVLSFVAYIVRHNCPSSKNVQSSFITAVRLHRSKTRSHLDYAPADKCLRLVGSNQSIQTWCHRLKNNGLATSLRVVNTVRSAISCSIRTYSCKPERLM